MLSLQQLEKWLMDAAYILKGPVDAADFKSYIFPLLFIKRILDVYEEEYMEAMVESCGDIEYAEFAENHRFNIPKDCRWSDLQNTSENVGAVIHKIFRSIEKANYKTLYGIFGDVDWKNKQKLPDILLKNLVEHFSLHNISNTNVEADIAGRAYEYLIKKFADKTNKKAGEFYTPRTVVQLMTLILDPTEGESVYDPACGTGGMLLQAIKHVSDKAEDVRLLKVYGQEKNLTTSAIARMNLFIHGREDFKIERGDTLRNPVFIFRNKLSTFDCVIANPPFSLKKWGFDGWGTDKWGRNEYGIPPVSYGDFAWVEHMLKSIAPGTGRMAVVLPHGVLFRKGSEQDIRKQIIEDDKLEAVIGLGDNLFYGTTLAACIWVLKFKKATDKKRKVLFVDASKIYKHQRAQNILSNENVSEIFKLYSDFADVDNCAKVVSFDDIKKNGFNLNISIYIDKPREGNGISISEAISAIKEACTKSKAADEKLKKMIEKMEVGV